MESLTDLRDARYESVNGDRAGTEQRAAREWTVGREEYPAEYQLHYQEDYGTTMTDNQYKNINEGQSTFKDSVVKAKSQVEDTRAEVQTLYDQQNKKLDDSLSNLPSDYESFSTTLYSNPEWLSAAKKSYYEFNEYSFDNSTSLGPKREVTPPLTDPFVQDRISREYVDHLKSNAGFNSFLESWAPGNAVKVYVRDPVNPGVNKDYWVMPEAASAIDALDFQGYGDAVRNSDGSVTVFSDTNALAVRKQLDVYEIGLYRALGKAYAPAVQQSVASGKASLNDEYTLAGESLASQQRQIAAKEEENLSSLNLIRSTYAKKLSNMSDSIGSMNYAKSI